MYKFFLKRNKILYKRLLTSLRKAVRKTEKFIIFCLKKGGFIRDKRRKISTFEKIFFRFVPVALVVMVGIAISGITITSAFFDAKEISSGNIMQSSQLEVVISGKNISGVINPNDATTTYITLSKSSPAGLDYQYTASSTIVSNDQSVCDYIDLVASSTGQTYSGSLKNFLYATNTPTSTTNWNFTFKVASSVPEVAMDKTCGFKIVYTAWQTNLATSSVGFNDKKEMTGSIQIEPKISDVVLNEILPDPVETDTDPMPNGEWLELYNNTNAPIDLAGYYLTDAGSHRIDVEGCRIISGSTIISGKGFLVVYVRGSGTCTSHNFSLNNTGDTVVLHNSSDVVLDSLTYTHSSPGKSIARIPDGIGTWVDPIPTPGEPNKMEENVSETSVTPDIISENKEVSSTTSVVIEVDIIPETGTSTEPQILPEVTTSSPEPIIKPEPVIVEPVNETPVIKEPEPAIQTDEIVGTSTESTEITPELPPNP